MHPLGLIVGDPKRKVHPFLDPMVAEEVSIDPDEPRVGARHTSTRFEQLAPRDALVDGVERACLLPFGKRDHPFTQVTDVDELDSAPRRCWSYDIAAASDTVWPIREPPGRIVRADDQPRADDRVPVG